MNTDSFSKLGKLPVNETSAAGSDVRDDAEYDSIENEIAKLNNPSTSNTINWQLVCDASAGILLNKSKDILVACYMTCGLLQTSGLTGLSQGMSVLADMLETFWDTLYPPVTRMRARRNAIQFLIDHIQQKATESNWSSMTPQDPVLIHNLLDSVNRIDTFIQDKDGDAPSMRQLKNVFNSIPVIEETPSSTEVKQASTEVSNQEKANLLPAALLPTAPASIEEVDQILEKINTLLGNISETIYESNLVNPLAFRLTRIAAWLSIEKAPPAKEHQTMVPPPNSQLLDALRGLQETMANENIIRFAETQLPQHPFWLDLNRICAEALNRMGADDAQREVSAATHYFSTRLPELTALTFSNGMPFADAQTQTWLLQQGSSASETSGSNTDKLQESVRHARAIAADGKLGEAADFLQQQIDQASSPRDKLAYRIHLCELMSDQRPAGNLLPFAIAILEEIDRFQLTEWDPVLALSGLKATYNVMSQNDEANANKVLAKIVQLDAGSAVRLII